MVVIPPNSADISKEKKKIVRAKIERKYICNCGKSFKRNQSLNSHRNFVCGKVKSYFCINCRKFFWAKHQLQLHLETCMKH